MSSLALKQHQNQLKLSLTIARGPDRGQAFQILNQQVLIGRDLTNQVVLQDPKCSRVQAAINVRTDRVYIEDLSSKQSTFVNSKPVESRELKDGDKIEIGDTIIVFRAEANQPKQKSLQAANPNLASIQGLPIQPNHYPKTTRRPSKNSGKKSGGRLRFYTIVFIVLGSLTYFITSTPPVNKVEPSVRSQDKADSEIKRAEAQATLASAGKKLDTAEAKSRYEQAQRKYKTGNEKYNDADFQGAMKDFEDVIGLFADYFGTKKFGSVEEHTKYIEANKHYLEGFRDYNKGQYSRAIRSFETALAIDPTHKLANRYREYAFRSREEFIAGQLESGKQYLEKQMYSRCSAALEKVLVEIRNENDLRYKEAVSLKRVCDSYVRRED